MNATKCQTCKSGTYLSPFYDCLNCSTNCLTCSDSISCVNCTTGSFLYNGQCITTCPSGYYKYNTDCQKCPISCVTCSSQANCTTCISQYTLDSYGNCIQIIC